MNIPERVDVHIHLHMGVEQQHGDVAPPVLALLQCGLAEIHKVNAQLEILSAFLQQQGTKMTAIDDRLTALQASTAKIEGTVDSVRNFVAGIPGVVQAAVDEALAKGATPEQLQAFDDLNTRLSADADAIVAALTVPGSQQPPADTPPADGGTPA